MKIMTKKRVILCIVLIAFNSYVKTDLLSGKSFFSSKSDNLNIICGKENIYYSLFFKKKLDQDYFYKQGRPYLNTTISYNSSFKKKDIVNYFFGQERLTFSGSRVEGRKSTDILSDYFGVPSDFKSIVSFSPKVKTVSVCINGAVGLEALSKKLYAKIKVPFVYKSFDLRLKEVIEDQGTNFHPAGYMSGGNGQLLREDLVQDIQTAFQGEKKFGDMRNPLQFAKIDGCQRKFGCADITIEILKKIINKKRKQLDFYLKSVIPTGTRPNGQYLFEPIIGNNHHWQLGIGFSGSYFCYYNEQKDKKIQLYFDFVVSHLFSSKQKRSFDLKNNGLASRYMLMQEFNIASDGVLQVPQGTNPIYQYAGSLIPVVNKTTLDCRVNVAVQTDLFLKCIYYTKHWKISTGYNFWLRSGEKIHSRQRFKDNTYGLKGDVQMYGFITNTVDVAIPVNATQSEATLYSPQGDGNLHATLLANDFTNQNADNNALAQELATPGALNHLTGDDRTALNVAGPLQIRGSNIPILLKDSDIDEKSAQAPRSSSHKFFVSADYIWIEKKLRPSISCGVQVEYAGTHNSIKGVLSQWGLWVSTGITI